MEIRPTKEEEPRVIHWRNSAVVYVLDYRPDLRWASDSVYLIEDAEVYDVDNNVLGVLHRVDGPAYIDEEEQIEEWHLYGRFHRIGGPARMDGKQNYKAWYFHGRKHRTDGPAVIWGDGSVSFFIKGRGLTRAEFLKHFDIGGGGE